jgi:hypothetical protein
MSDPSAFFFSSMIRDALKRAALWLAAGALIVVFAALLAKQWRQTGPRAAIESGSPVASASSAPSPADRSTQAERIASMQPSRSGEDEAATSVSLAEWWQKDPTAAEAYVAGHTDGLVGSANVSMMAGMIYDKDPRHAQQWINQLGTVEARRTAEMAIASRMAMTDPHAAADWTQALPDNQNAAALAEVMNVWTLSDRNAAADYIKHLDGQVHDAALAGFAGRIAIGSGGTGGDPQQAANIAASIADPAIQQSSVENVMKIWLNQNPSAATQWIEGSGLPEAEKQRLRALPPGQ